MESASPAGSGQAPGVAKSFHDGPREKSHIYFGPVSAAAPEGVAAVSDVVGEVDASPPDDGEEPAVQKQQELLKRFEVQQKASNFQAVCPTHDRTVRKVLRALGHPICLFGEGPFERRQRLKVLFAEGVSLSPEELQNFTLEDESLSRAARVEEASAEDVAEDELFFTEGTESLLEARRLMFGDSVRRARLRLRQEQQLKRDVPKPLSLKSQAALLLPSASSPSLSPLPKDSVLRRVCQFCSHLQSQLAVRASQVGDDRPLTCCRFSPGSSRLLRFSSRPDIATKATEEGSEETGEAPLKRVKTERGESDTAEADRRKAAREEGVSCLGEKASDLIADPHLQESWGGPFALQCCRSKSAGL